MFLNNPLPDAFGMDIGDLSVKIVQLKRHTPVGAPPFFTLETKRSVNLPPGAIINGEILHPEIVRKKILHIIGKDGAYPKIKSPWVVADLPEPQTFLKLIDIPTSSADLLYDEIAFHASKHLPFELEDTYLDWQIINPKPEEKFSKVLIAAAPKIIADSFTYLLEASELLPLVLEAEAVAVSRALLTANKDYAGIARAFLDLGGTRSSMIVYDHDSIQFSKSLAFSGEMFTTAIAQGLKIDHDEAEKLKIANGLKYDPEHPNYLKVVEKLVNDLIDQIEEALHFYKSHFSDSNPITHITMSGGSSYVANLDTVLSQKLKISTRPGNVWKNLCNKKLGTNEIRKDIDYAAAIGLSLRAAQNPLITNSV